MSLQAIANKIHCSHAFVSKWIARFQQCGSVEDKPRSGRPSKANAVTQQCVLNAAGLPECSSAAAIAAQVQHDRGVVLSKSTVRSILKQKGLKHLFPRIVPLLTDKQRLTRVKFAKAALRRERVSWRRTMVTDSKYFLLHAKGRPAGRWCTTKTRGKVPRVKHSVGVHVYMGLTYWGTTKLMFVTGTKGQVSPYKHPKTQLPLPGVGSQGYSDVVTVTFKPEGDRLFQQSPKWSKSWQLQQDNAPPHKTPTNMALIANIIPGGHFLAWPPNSPDLSPIENLWGWMDKQLHKQGPCKTVKELKGKLEAIKQSISARQLHALFDGMDARMRRVIELDGDHIGK